MSAGPGAQAAFGVLGQEIVQGAADLGLVRDGRGNNLPDRFFSGKDAMSFLTG